MTSYSNYSSEILYIAKEASQLIMDYYSSKVDISIKSDNSPVTEADLAANNLIVGKLNELTPEIPVVSEENSEDDNIKAAANNVFWIVDPLDGTKSFINKTDEFTVNISLIKDNVPDGGAVYLPAKEIGYFTAEDGNAYKQIGNNLPDQIEAREKPEEEIIVIASKSHMNTQTSEYIANLGDKAKILSASSSMKFCMVAEGSADLYPRFGNTMEWDTAAGHAVLTAAGGHVLHPDGQPLTYRKKDFLNPFFIASGK